MWAKARKKSVFTSLLILLPVFVILVLVVVLCSAGVGPLQAREEQDGCGEELASHLAHSRGSLVQVHQSTQPQHTHLPVMETGPGKGQK